MKNCLSHTIIHSMPISLNISHFQRSSIIALFIFVPSKELEMIYISILSTSGIEWAHYWITLKGRCVFWKNPLILKPSFLFTPRPSNRKIEKVVLLIISLFDRKNHFYISTHLSIFFIVNFFQWNALRNFSRVLIYSLQAKSLFYPSKIDTTRSFRHILHVYLSSSASDCWIDETRGDIIYRNQSIWFDAK